MAKFTVSHLLSRLKELRKARGLSQEAFAEGAGIGYKYYQALETGRRPNMRLTTLERLAKAHGIELYQLLSPEMPRIPKSKKPKKRLSP